MAGAARRDKTEEDLLAGWTGPGSDMQGRESLPSPPLPSPGGRRRWSDSGHVSCDLFPFAWLVAAERARPNIAASQGRSWVACRVLPVAALGRPEDDDARGSPVRSLYRTSGVRCDEAPRLGSTGHPTTRRRAEIQTAGRRWTVYQLFFPRLLQFACSGTDRLN